ncbi:hypothetical protein V2I01_22650 [Micromonospora sp. BRA006-A]|nr:hypothetical protein [Micromonospora sp. BRA006-A]
MRGNASRSPLPVEDAVLAVEVISPTSTFRDMYDRPGSTRTPVSAPTTGCSTRSREDHAD